MKVSQYLLATVKEVPSDAEIMSHKLMIRAGLIRQLASGLYSWLPLGLRVLKKVENIVREEMDRAGALEILMPAIQPSELWEESGRWDVYGKELLRITDRHGREFCFGPTHEEIVTDIARREISSYKQLPITLYQIQTKFRDEIRPRFGIMRAREFLMKDAYSFDIDAKGMEASYQKMFDAYTQIFTRLGLDFRAVIADSGAIGGAVSTEFQVLAASGEDTIVHSDTSDYAANLEKAESAPLPEPKKKEFKVIIVKGEKDSVAIVLRKEHELNDVKAHNHQLISEPLVVVEENSTKKLGDLKMPVLVDRDVNWKLDIKPTEVVDLRNVVEGDPSPDGKGKLRFARGIEVGHVFQLGDKYSKSMNAKVLAENGKALPLQMGCYGIGVSRIVASAIEQNHDAKGIIWPEPMAPFSVVIIPIQMHKSYRVREEAEKIYNALLEKGVKVLIDDRKERPGVMFSDMDLIGIPHRIVIGERGLDAGTVEYKFRAHEDSQNWPIGDVVEKLTAAIAV